MTLFPLFLIQTACNPYKRALWKRRHVQQSDAGYVQVILTNGEKNGDGHVNIDVINFDGHGIGYPFVPIFIASSLKKKGIIAKKWGPAEMLTPFPENYVSEEAVLVGIYTNIHTSGNYTLDMLNIKRELFQDVSPYLPEFVSDNSGQ